MEIKAATAGNRVVMIGLDAFDPHLAQAWAAAGELPTLAQLLAQGSRCVVHNPFGLFVGALWVSFASAQRPERHGYHCWDEVDPASYRWRLNPPKPERYRAFWNQIGDAGRRIAAIDVPHARAAPPVNGLELCEYGCHDRHYGLHSAPPERARALAARFGLHPALGLDPWRERHFAADDVVARRGRYRTPIEEKEIADRLVAGAATKGRLVEALLEEEAWDLFVAVFGESHAVGHQQWHLHDEGHPRFDAAARDLAGGDPVLRVYREMDAALGRAVAALPADAALLVHLSHGMGAHHDGTHLLDEVLARLDGGPVGAEAPRRGALRQALKPLLPPLQQVADRWRVPGRLRTATAQILRGERPRARARRRFFAQPNNSVYGGIRLNLAGREPEGRIRPDEAEEVIRSLERDLLDLVNVETGGPVVRALHRADRHHRRVPGDTMPDLFVEWERGAPIEKVRSPRIGIVETR
ncbi:MAG TPA: alkaline phosphatase family protein, partial [Allosphingosinicella sp.]|nr:alkaline phosphatase family protein [Allosphingosinicella sp.]